MSYTAAEVSAAISAMNKDRGDERMEVGAAVMVVGLSAERAAKEVQIPDDMMRGAHRAGASLRQLAGGLRAGSKDGSSDHGRIRPRCGVKVPSSRVLAAHRTHHRRWSGLAAVAHASAGIPIAGRR
jgi:hypothetical protein